MEILSTISTALLKKNHKWIIVLLLTQTAILYTNTVFAQVARYGQYNMIPQNNDQNPGERIRNSKYNSSYYGIDFHVNNGVVMRVLNGGDASLDNDGSGYLILGSVSSTNLVFDNNEIMARSNGNISPLNLQTEGGDFIIHNNNSEQEKFIVKDNGNVGIGTDAPAALLHLKGENADGTSQLVLHNTKGNTNSSTGVDFRHSGDERLQAYIRDEITGGWPTKLHFGTASGVNNATTKMTIDANGNVGISTTDPAAQLSLGGWDTGSSGSDADESAQLLLSGSHNSGVNTGGTNGTYKLKIEGYNNDGSVVYPIYLQDENSTVDFWIKNRASESATPTMYFAGNTGIGTTTPSEKLEVAGKIKADGVVLNVGTFPDYVFEENYKLMPLADLEAYIKVNKHLPNVPSEEEVVQNGADLGQLNHLLVEKVEELTLYTIGQEKALKAQQAQIEALTDAVTLLKKQMDDQDDH